MKNEHVTPEDFAVLETRYGNHTQAAKEVGLDRRHYRRLRAGKFVGGMAARVVSMAAAEARKFLQLTRPTSSREPTQGEGDAA